MKKISSFLAIMFWVGFTHFSFGQGCSDAGFCTIDSFKPTASDSSETTRKNVIKYGASIGRADHNITVFSAQLEYQRRFSDKFSTDSKLVFLTQSGNNFNASGLSDFYFNTNYAVSDALKITAGVKIPITNGNKTEAGLALPMDYQTSLGTFDLILGAGYTIKKLRLVAAWQQPLTQNSNSFLATTYPEGSALREFVSTNNYKRAGDVLLRASYPVTVSKKLTLLPSLLPIYHLAEDRFTNAAGEEKAIAGSSGLTLNANVYVDYKVNAANSLNLSFGAPFITRKVRPDGLTRAYVLTLEQRIRF